MASTPTRPVDNVVITTKGLQDRNINILDGTTVENNGKLIFRLVQHVATWWSCGANNNLINLKKKLVVCKGRLWTIIFRDNVIRKHW